VAMSFEPGRRYRMPVVFGPSISPRAGPDGEIPDLTAARTTVAGARFLTDAALLDRLLPPGFALEGEPVVTVEFHYLTNLAWLAGRGYNIVKILYPARFRGARDEAAGPFSAVLWENRGDCCTTGREEIGVAKIFADIDPPVGGAGGDLYRASGDGHGFLEMTLANLVDTPPPPPPAWDGVLHYLYVPKFGRPGEAEVEHAVLTPPAPGAQKIVDYAAGEGIVAFHRASFAQLPTQYRIVGALADLPILEPRGGYRLTVAGGRDLADQRALF
jgi:hypothetical protein